MPLDLMTRLDPLRRIRCPFCFEKFAAYEMHLRCNDHVCKTDYTRMIDDPILSRTLQGRNAVRDGAALRGPWWVDPRQDARRGWRRFVDWMVLPGALDCPNCAHATDYRLCPRCHSHLPDSVVTLPSNHIAIFGPQSVGKTTFVTVLIHELDNRVGPEHNFILSPLTDEIRERYEHEYHDVTYGSNQFGVGEEGTDSLRRSHAGTPSIEINRGILHPLVYRLTRRGSGQKRHNVLLSFFDTAGEDWEMNFDLLRSEANYLRYARGLLFLVDPLRIREVAHALRHSLTEKERMVPSADYLNDARKLASIFHRSPVNVPLAIVLNKLDRWGGIMEAGTLLHEIARGVPVPELAPRNPDVAIHEEVRSALRRWGAAGFLEHVETNFPVHRFFACSALGDAAQPDPDAPQPLPTPLLIERPVLWLMERQGIIRPGS
jgi:GTPase SAR1 family protein